MIGIKKLWRTRHSHALHSLELMDGRMRDWRRERTLHCGCPRTLRWLWSSPLGEREAACRLVIVERQRHDTRLTSALRNLRCFMLKPAAGIRVLSYKIHWSYRALLEHWSACALISILWSGVGMFATRRVLVLAFAAISAAPGVARQDVVSTIVGGGLLRPCLGSCRPRVVAAARVLFPVSGRGRGSDSARRHASSCRPADAAGPLGAPEVYGARLVEHSVIPPQVSARNRVAEVSWVGRSEGLEASQVKNRVPAGVAPGSAVHARMLCVNGRSNEVTIGLELEQP
jgi:hypothetical protein